MPDYSLNVTQEKPNSFRWVLVKLVGQEVLPHTQAEREFGSFEAAQNAGTLALMTAHGTYRAF
jgi:hypothetical protein